MSESSRTKDPLAPDSRPSVPLAIVAEHAGVSIPTVSKVLNSRPDVAPATRERVTKVLANFGLEVRRARPRATGLLDLRVENLLGIWSEELVRGVVAAANEVSLDVVISVGPQQESGDAWIDHALRRGTDGLIAVVGVPSIGAREHVAEAGLPFVTVDPWSPVDENALVVSATNWQGGLTATGHLIALGHRRIGTITGALDLDNALARLGGYRAALIKAGLPTDESLIRVGNYSTHAGYQGARYFLSLDEPPTAIFAASDDMAIGAMRAYREAGLRVPDDVSIVGFDDLPTAQWIEPALTTIRQPLASMGAAAVDLVHRFRSGLHYPPRMELATELVERKTTARLG